mgnify:CR=1 FL=1
MHIIQTRSDTFRRQNSAGHNLTLFSPAFKLDPSQSVRRTGQNTHRAPPIGENEESSDSVEMAGGLRGSGMAKGWQS